MKPTLIDKNVDSLGSQKSALITGANGFTGKFVKQSLLALGYKVTGLGVERSLEENHLEVSLLDIESVRSVISKVLPDVVIHLGAISSVTHGDVAEMYEVNVLGTRNLLRCLASEGCGQRSVILASSANVYGNSSIESISEIKSPLPENDYAVSKLAMEYMARLWSDKLPITITRPFNYTGRGQSVKFLVPKIVEHFKNRAEVIELGNVDVYRDFSDVRTVAWAYAQLAQNPAPSEVFNISSGVGVSITQIISTLEELTGHQIKIKVNPEFIRAHEVKTLTGDSTRLWDHIGMPARISIKETLEWMLDE